MKKIYKCLLASIVLSSLSFLSSCTREKINYGEIHTYTSEEVQKLFENAIKRETIGEPIIEKSENKIDSNTTISHIVTTQTYLLYVGRTKDGHLIPKSEIKEPEIQAMINDGRGPIVVSGCCALACSKDAPDCPDNKGCSPENGGCTSFSCGTGCEALSCSTCSIGFGFGMAIIF